MAEIRLIVVDLDGTILGPREEVYGHAVVFRSKLDTLADSTGTKWAVNTGRGIMSFRRVFRPMWSLGIVPDYIVVRHAYIFGVKSWGYIPHSLWNIQIWTSILLARLRARLTIRRLTRTILSRFRHVRYRRIGRYSVSFKFRDSENTDEAYYLLRVLTRPHRNLMVSEHVREIVLSTIPFTKGLAVSHLARHLNIPAENILCIGDGHNDISMLDGTAAGMTACPSNATIEVMQTVHKSRGHVSRQPSLAGTIDAIEAYESGTVNSSLPEDIAILIESARNMAPRERSSGRHGIYTAFARDFILVGLCCLAVLLALASARLLGPLSRYLMLPVERMAELLAGLMGSGV